MESGIRELSTWKSLPPKKVPGWLEAAVRFHSSQMDVPNKVVTIDCDGLDSELKFHCALGEAVNGPGGYFGRGLDGLSDCFCGGFGVIGKFTLNWLNHEVYKNRFPEYFDSIVEVFKSRNMTLNLG
ncbi:MAG: barstar family protein [Cytophagales bacterium]|nr:barstar family protein [Cytophagales bacterium]